MPAYERAVCPPRALAIRLGPDGLVHSAVSPDHTYVAPPGRTHGEVIGNFEHRVLTQQPLRVVGGVLGDATRLFELHRVTSTGRHADLPLAVPDQLPDLRRQHLPQPRPHHHAGPAFPASGGPVQVRPLPASMGGQATVAQPLASFLRGYQLHGGYTPGPLLALATLAGLAGALIALAGGLAAARGRGFLTGRQRELALACLLVFGSAAAILLASDLFEFSWRYQLPALVTLPPAGALGLALLGSLLRRRAPAATPEGPNGSVPGDSPAPAGGTARSPSRTPPADPLPRPILPWPRGRSGRPVDRVVDDPVDSGPARGITRPPVWKSCS